MNAFEKVSYRLLFAAAAAYNVAFAVWSGCFPTEFFALIDAPPPDRWRLVAAVVGSFSLLYAYAAWRPERGSLAVALGLASKVLGPQMWLLAVTHGDSTPRLFPLVFIGDVIWWLPFVLYLLRRTRHAPMTTAAWCFGMHLLANVYLLRIAGGTELEVHMAARQQFVLESVGLWTAAWLFWALASTSLLGFCIAWAARIQQPRALLGLALAIVTVGVLFDLRGETLLVTQATRDDLSVAEFAAVARRYQWFGPVIANGLYCVGGLLLSVASWRAGFLRGTGGLVGIAVWIVGLGLTAAAVAGHRLGMVMTGGGVMLLFMPWSLYMTWRLRPTQETPHSKPSATKPPSNSPAPSNS